MTRRTIMGGLLAILACAALAPSAPLPADGFAGTWRVTLTPDDDTRHAGGKSFEDALLFEDGCLLTENFAYYGFAPGAYEVPADRPNAFSAEMLSNAKGSLAWTGVVVNGRIEGTLAWTRRDGSVWRFTFAGVRTE